MMKNFMADEENEFHLLADTLFHHRSVLFKVAAGVVLVLVLIGLGLEVHHLLPLQGP